MDLSGATILLTGGTGSFGNAFARRVTRDWPDSVVRVYSRDELKQSEMLSRFGDGPDLRGHAVPLSKQLLATVTQRAADHAGRWDERRAQVLLR